ncbi:MAG TPA: hydantoinase B/oxoprolinase family protein [Solirubrobacterales bacterium]|nr:hydantoinase B/oxoprolinase family protein [Solirubrobacterales bacterium]
MAIVDATRELEPREAAGIGWDGKRLDEMLAESERLFEETGNYRGLDDLELKDSDPIGYEKLFSRIRGGLVSARETAMNISASPIVRELGELCFALYSPEGDSVALSTGIIVHVHTMSDAIKYMVRHGWEDNPGIEPGDIFANNDPVIGDVHNADVQTFVPIFWEGELVAWAGGVTHVVDIGAKTPGGVPFGPITRLDDGLDLPCMKIGENDELAAWHLKRCETQTRAPMYYLLDEKTRLAGCHMIREAVERVILEVGIDPFKRFSREVVEEGRRSFKSRIREMTVPGRYRSPAFGELTLTDKEALPAQARRDIVLHSPFEVRIGGDGTYALDFDGASAWGHHSLNCTPSAMQGAIWVQFTQTLICNDKVNDGAYLALETNFPPGTMANMGDAGGSTGAAWGYLIPAFTGFPRTISRALQARGFIEEVIGAYACAGNCYQGGGIDQYGNSSAITHFELAAQGMGAKYVLDGTDHAAAMFNPEGDMGDIEMWELISPIVYLSRRRKASSGGPGRHRGGSSHEAVFLHHNTPFWAVQNMGAGKMFTSPGLFGGYPGGLAYVHNVRGADLVGRAAAGEAYPVADGSFDEPALMEIGGEHEYKQDNFTTEQPIGEGDLYLLVLRGGSGLGDPLLRPPEAVAEDVRDDHLLPRFADSVYGVALGEDGAPDAAGTERRREEIRGARLDRAVPVREWWAAQRERLLARELFAPIQVMLAESMRLSPRWAAEFRGFWDLPEDFELEVTTPTIPIERSEPGKLAPEQAADEFLATSEVSGGTAREVEAAGALERDNLAAMLDEKLTRRQIRDVQAGYKDADRFEKWLAILQDRVPYDDPIVLPAGEGLNVVRRGVDSELVIRCDCGHDFCAATRNWKLDAIVYVRDSVESMREVFPQMSHADPEWMELREFYCPSCARQLEVECSPPGYPVVHEFLPDVEGFYSGWLGRDVP